MKKLLKFTILIAFSLLTENYLWGNLTYDNAVYTLLKVSVILMIFELLLKPIIKLLFLPINLLTLGSIRFVIDTLGFYLAVFLLSDFHLGNIHLPPSVFFGFTLPEFKFSGFFAYLVSSLTLSFILYFYNSILIKKEKIS
ncbi:MAG TPA: phage holin family protein [Patescibacteria group bacterium]